MPGFWLATAVNPGAFVARTPFQDAVKAALPTVVGLRAVACADGDGVCRRFAIAVGESGSQAVALIFRLEPWLEPAIIGASISDTTGRLASLESPLGNYHFAEFSGRE